MAFFLLGSRRVLEVSFNIHTNVTNYLLVLPLQGESSNKLRWLGYLWKWMSSLQSCLKKLRQGVKIKNFQKEKRLFHLKDIRSYCERTWLLPVKSECFSGKNLKCFVTDCKRRHQSKTGVIQLPCQVLIFFILFL